MTVLPFTVRPQPAQANAEPRTRLTTTVTADMLVVIEREIEDPESYLGWQSIPGTQVPLTRAEIRGLVDQLAACEDQFADWDEAAR